tara:strand:+ start:1641 stop:1964 length:324 start_codon:yes stop_codon:yes gene_type:complete
MTSRRDNLGPITESSIYNQLPSFSQLDPLVEVELAVCQFDGTVHALDAVAVLMEVRSAGGSKGDDLHFTVSSFLRSEEMVNQLIDNLERYKLMVFRKGTKLGEVPGA